MKIKANPDILTIKDVENRSIILRLINNLKTTDYKNLKTDPILSAPFINPLNATCCIYTT